jgi:hypothetical protein
VRRLLARCQREDVSAVDDSVVLPPRAGEDEVAGLEARRVRRHDAADRLADHRVADRRRRRVDRCDLVHRLAHVRVEGQVEATEQHLALAGVGHRRFFQPEVLERGRAMRAGGEDDTTVDRLVLGHRGRSIIDRSSSGT